MKILRLKEEKDEESETGKKNRKKAGGKKTWKSKIRIKRRMWLIVQKDEKGKKILENGKNVKTERQG